jgi:signal transduction histidine kinase
MSTNELIRLRWLLEKAIAELADSAPADAEVKDNMRAVLAYVHYGAILGVSQYYA